MPRANRHFLPGLWLGHHHRSHRKSFLLKFARDRRSYLHWLFEAKERFGVSVLNYTVTCNHVHLLVKDTGPDVIANSIQLTSMNDIRILNSFISFRFLPPCLDYRCDTGSVQGCDRNYPHLS